MNMPLAASSSIDWSAYAVSEDIRELLNTARAHFASLVSDDDLRAVHDGATKTPLWGTLVDHGYTLVGMPESHDGIGTLADLMALLEESGRALLPAPLVSHSAATHTLLAAGLTELISESDQLAIVTHFGDEAIAFDAEGATHVVTVTPSSQGSSVCRYATSGTNPAGEHLENVDPSRANVSFAASALTLIESAEITASPDQVLAAARTCIAADLIGTAERALQGAIAHALTRVQFDRVIGSFQGIKHKLADAHVLNERARSLTLGAAVAIGEDRLSTRAATLALLAKASAADAAANATGLHTQLLGAMGLTFESDASLGVRRARHTMPILGSAGSLYTRGASVALAEGNRS